MPARRRPAGRDYVLPHVNADAGLLSMDYPDDEGYSSARDSEEFNAGHTYDSARRDNNPAQNDISFDDFVETSLSKVHCGVENLAKSVYDLRRQLKESIEPASGVCSDQGNGALPHLEKVRLSLEVHVNELSEELDDIRVKGGPLFYTHLKKLIHARLDNLEQKTKEILIRSYCNDAADQGLSSFFPHGCWGALIRLETRATALSDDITSTLKAYLPHPHQTVPELRVDSSDALVEIVRLLPEESVQYLLRKKQQWQRELHSQTAVLDSLHPQAEEIAEQTAQNDSEGPGSDSFFEKLCKELACRKRIFSAKLDMFKTLLDSMRVLDVDDDNSFCLQTSGSMFWMLQEAGRDLLELTVPLNRGDTIPYPPPSNLEIVESTAFG